MKLSIIVSTLTLFASSADAFVAPNQSANTHHQILTSLSYKAANKSVEPTTADVVRPMRPTIGSPGEDAETAALAASLGIDDIIIRQEYGKWLARYDKTADVTRYPQFKKNFLIQFQNDLKYGKFYTLNEYGDCSEEEYKAIITQKLKEQEEKKKKEPVVEIIEEVKIRKSTQPTPAAGLALEACQKMLAERFAAISAMGDDAIKMLSDLVCRGGINSQK